jgi:xylulokinase
MLGGSHQRLAAAAAALPPGSDGVVFLPQMGGRVLPESNSGVTAAFSGIRRSTRREHLYRAVLEGNAFALKAAREALLALGLPDGDIYLTGGGSRSPLWRQILADVFARPVRWAAVEEGCRGGAMFAAVCAGAHPDIYRAMKAMSGETHVTEPGTATAAYADAFTHFVRVREAIDRA